ncbi:hypothetical protein ACC713_09590 [Rhizobium johnstonii]|uniref:hypothetical protein n=1 Tax=Rhizobium TaxID=379 RepID=UPI00103162D1|nr:hypothetical protein [Rhizobium leguminosarum]QIO68003.1 hypothetical protein HA462_24210 [Rhizobium leguminosarum bv. trifolii]NKL55917.1 hypothetical protein [Rhizobium leguminosarum bv. viciae]TBF83825.1 hypothetical protein ELG86_17525 [Rhizobium leguminosarum]TBG69401.1 hypothetical protein ELG74_16730 [Rhizobium leguminosarum]TBH03270.1 hypothetical protein ELG70_17295 [Rhizobium leguminosarum]
MNVGRCPAEGDVPGGLATIFQHLNLMATGKSSDLPVAPLKALAFLLLSRGTNLQPDRAEALAP